MSSAKCSLIADLIAFSDSRARCETLASHGLDPQANDNRIVAAAQQYADRPSSAGIRTVILSQNTAVQLTCQMLGIEWKEIDESLRIPDELSDIEKELRTAKVELAKLTNSRPKLAIGFRDANGSLQHSKFEVRDTSPLK